MYDATFKVMLFGDAGCGKTAVTQKFLTNLFVSDSKMTIGVDFEVKSLVVDHQRVKLQIWDFGGEERFRFLLPTYVRGVKGGLFFYNTVNYSTIAHIDDWITIIKKEIKAEEAFPIIAVGINSELENMREIPYEDGIKIAKSRGLDGIGECNVITGENVEKIFEELTRIMIESSTSEQKKAKERLQFYKYNYLFKVILLAYVSENEENYLRAYFKDFYDENYKLTIGIEVLHKGIEISNKKIKLQMWNLDLNRSSLKFVSQAYLVGANGVVMIFDVTNDTKVSEIRHKVLLAKKNYNLEDKSLPIIVLGNKEKLVDHKLRFDSESITLGKLVRVDAFIECSLISNENIEKAFETLARVLLDDFKKQKSDPILEFYRKSSEVKITKETVEEDLYRKSPEVKFTKKTVEEDLYRKSPEVKFTKDAAEEALLIISIVIIIIIIIFMFTLNLH